MLHSFAAAKSLAGHFLLVLKMLLKMTIVRMRQGNGVPVTCCHSKLHIVMDRWEVTVSKNWRVALLTTMLLAWQNAAHRATAWTLAWHWQRHFTTKNGHDGRQLELQIVGHDSCIDCDCSMIVEMC